ncbi:type IV secretion system protein VirB3 [Acinetobacter calcoaceticus]|uniref:type IV secretion system protein VirB3 n=1 Tax=Acinetobacter calcoaceticus TaxID=471 RepID=UPI00124C3F80|nr:VirB3 family type IV secretion system protein [Acinetobacter calcoaceticus]
MAGFSDPIFRGCTRPAMMFGVPMLPFLLLTGAVILLAGWSFYLFSPYFCLFLIAVYLPVYFWLRQITKKDDQRLKQVMMRWRMRFRQIGNHRHWGAISYSPIKFKNRK